MGMTTLLNGYVSEDNPEYQKHKKILLMCKEYEVSLPKETADYFGSSSPDEYLLKERLELELTKGEHYDSINGSDENGFEIYIDKLPSNVSLIRVENSW